MSDEHALAPVEQKTVIFYEDEITIVLVEEDGDQEVYVPIRPICDFLGVSWSGQRRRINRDPVLSEEVTPVNVTFTGHEHGQSQVVAMSCLPLDFLNGFLFGINPSRAKPEVQEQLIRYQRECYRVLADAFGRAEPSTDHLTPSQAALVQIREMGLAIASMAEQQLELERRTTATEERLEQAAQYMGQFNRRLKVLERRLAPGEELTKEQAFEIKERVTRIALELARHDPSKSHFAEVYRSLSLQTKRTSYKDIPQSTYESAIKFLDDWLIALQSDERG